MGGTHTLLWCNDSTGGSNPLSLGLNPNGRTNMWIHYLIIKLFKYLKISNDEISECYKNKLYNSIKRIKKIKKFFKNNKLDDSKEYLYWKQKLLDETKN